MLSKVEIVSNEDIAPSTYEPLEQELFRLIRDDDYFSTLPEAVMQSECQTIGHVQRDRTLSDLLPTAEAVTNMFEDHKSAIGRTESLCKSVITTCSEYKANQKALAKAKLQEDKQRKLLAEREAKKQKTLEERALKKAAELQAKREAAAQEEEQQQEDATVPKKRRVASKLLNEITADDPKVLQDRFPDHQMRVVEELESCIEFSSVQLIQIHLCKQEMFNKHYVSSWFMCLCFVSGVF